MKSIIILNNENGTVHILPNCLSSAASTSDMHEEALEIVSEWCDEDGGCKLGNVEWMAFDGNLHIGSLN